MDVRCRQCGTEYELDDARVGAAGTTVKCSSCGHVFKVMQSGNTADASGAVRAAAADGRAAVADDRSAPRGGGQETPVMGTPPSNPPQPAVGDWMVKKADGQVFRFRELTTLQKWIVERKVVRDDEISRTGRSWKKLGEIAELTSFFQVVEAADAAQRQVTASMMPQVHLTATPTGTFQAYPFHEMQAQQAAAAAQAQAQAMATPAPMASDPGSGPQRPLTLAPQPAPMADDSLDLDDDDPVLAWQRRRRRLSMAAVVVSIVVIAAVATAVVMQRRGSALPETTVKAVTEALSSGDATARGQALATLAATPSPQSGVVAARLLAEEARVARGALRLLDERKALGADAAAIGGSDAVALQTIVEDRLARANAAVFAARAKADADAAVLAQAALAAAAVALAQGDAPVVVKEAGTVREHAAALSEAERGSIDDELRLLLTLAEAAALKPDDSAGADTAIQKLARFDDGRAKSASVLLALTAARAAYEKAHAATPPAALDEVSAAATRQKLATLSTSDPRRAAADALLSAWATAPTPPAPPDGATPDGATPDGATPDGATPDGKKPDEAPDGKKPDGTKADDSAGGGDSFDALMRQGERALVSERSAAAYAAFKKATQKDTTSQRAWLKLGWAALDTGKKAEAVRAFERALSLSPGLSEAQFGLAEALRFSGRKDDAIAAYKRYLEMDPKGKDANIAKNALKQLE